MNWYDIEHGISFCAIDSHGDYIGRLSKLKHDMEAILIDPEDIDHPPAIALFDVDFKKGSEETRSNLIEMYLYVFGTLLSSKMTERQETLLTNVFELCFAIPGANIQTVQDIFLNGEKYRRDMEKMKDPGFWFDRFLHPKFYKDVKDQIIYRLDILKKNEIFWRIFSGTENRIDFNDIINRPSILLVSTSQNALGDKGSQVFGRFIITMLRQAAMNRAVISEDKRMPYFIYVDEGADYGNDAAFEKIITRC
jgi:hypothetical protein